jgi:hypothetical protein
MDSRVIAMERDLITRIHLCNDVLPKEIVAEDLDARVGSNTSVAVETMVKGFVRKNELGAGSVASLTSDGRRCLERFPASARTRKMKKLTTGHVLKGESCTVLWVV